MRPWWDSRGRRRIIELAAMALVVTVAVAFFVTETAPSSGPSMSPARAAARQTDAAPTTTTTVPLDRPVPLGVYGGPGGAPAVASLATTTGATVAYVLDYFDDSSWQSLSDPVWVVSQWAHTNYKMIWGVPMLPASGASLAQGAAGLYDAQFARLAQFLVDSGQGSSRLMLGFAANQPSTPWSVSTSDQAGAYVAYWRRIVDTMRAVPGAAFQFVWNLATSGTVPPATLYPGDNYVDTVATGVVDEITAPVPPGGRWSAIGGAPGAAEWFASFAALHQKQFSVISFILMPTSTPGGGGDDPLFLQQFVQWASEVHAAYAVVWDYGASSLSGGAFPASLAALGPGLGRTGTQNPSG